MQREATLPPDFAQYAGLVRYVQQVSDTEWSSSCPSCGGEVHQDRTWPDRCRWFLSGKHNGWCRRCGSLFWPDQAPGYTPPSPEELERWRREREQAELDRKRSAERALEHLRQDRVWLRYHERLNDYGRKWWEGRGISPKLQDWWRLGWRPDWIIAVGGKDYLTDSATIPLFDKGWQALNVKHRLVAPPPSIGKYRYELAGQPQPAFIANPENDLTGDVIVVEGEIKAMVVWATLRDVDARVVGLPGTHPSGDVISRLSEAERVTLIMDPGAQRAAWAIVKQLGRKRCRVLIPPVKVDDGILAADLTREDVLAMLRSAVPC